MLKLELVLRTPMKMEREELRKQKMVGNTQKRGLNSLRVGGNWVRAWVFFYHDLFVLLPQRKVRHLTSSEIGLQENVSFSCNACFCLQVQKSQFL